MSTAKMAKREVHPALRAIMAVDVTLTNQFCSFCEHFLPLRTMKVHYKMLELSCHGVPWLVGWLIFIWMANTSSLHEMQVNLYMGLWLDIVIVALIKAVVRRRRPALNVPDMPVTVGPDVFSFPSGHATRAVYLAYFFICLWPVSVMFHMPLISWSAAVCFSRVLLRRHHLLDVAAGVLVGIFEGVIVSALWCDESTSKMLISFLSDDK